MTDDTRLVAAGLSMLAMLIAGCGGDDPISPTAPSATLPAGAAPPGQTAPTVSALGETAPTVSALGETGALETGKTIGVDAEDAATSAAVSGVHTTINLSGIAWQRNAHNNKLIPDDATDDEGNGSASAMAADARVQLVHIWVRGNGTGLAVVDSHADVAGERLDLGGGIQYVLAYRRGENPARFVTNLSADDVRSIEDRSGGEEPKPAEGKGDDDDKGGDKGDDDDDGGVGSRLICVGNVRDVQTTVPAAAANYTVAYDRFLTPGCGVYENHRYFGKDVSWISYSSAADGGKLITYTVAANTTTSVRTGNIWIIDIGNNNTPTGRTAITQQARNERPTVSIACAPAGACNGEETYTGQTVTLTATAADPDSHDTLHYVWASEGYGDLDPNDTGITEASVVWRAGKAGTDTRITVTVVDRENPEASDKLEASATVTIRTVAPPDCYIALSGNLTDFGQGTGFPVGADVGQLYYALSRDNRCTDPVLSDFRTTAPGWIRALSMDTSTDPDHPRENKDGWDHFIEFQVDANPTYAIRQADVWVAGSSERSTLRQQAATRPRPTCPTTAITHTRTAWTVGGSYRGSGFTQPWAKMGYGTPGGCRVNGLSLSQPGHVKVCGYNVADADAQAACAAAPAAVRATHSTDPTAGAVTYVTNSGSYTATATGNTAAAQWVEFIVNEEATSGTLSLAVGTSSGGGTVYLHFGYEHASDLSYGDRDYERWNVGTPTWTFSPAASTTTGAEVSIPTLTETLPGVFIVDCAATNGRPTGSDDDSTDDDGFSVRVSAAQGSPSVTYTASAAHPTYPRICKP